MGHKLGYISGSILLLLGVIMLSISNIVIHKYVLLNMRLVLGTRLFNQWLNPPLDIYMTFYLFDLKNAPEFLNGEKPKFEEVGPFVFRELITKEDVVDNLNFTISYTEKRQYVFEPKLSPFEIDYEITSLNMAVVTVVSQLKYSPDWMHHAVNIALSMTGDNSLLVKKPVREILFGYEDNFLKQLKKLVPSLVPTEIVGLFTGRNGTVYTKNTIYSGADDYKKVGAVERYYYADKLNFWSSPYANMINGTDGSVLSPYINEGDIIYSFQKDLCRSIYGRAQEKVKIINDIEVLKFSPDEYFFANVSVNPDNAGFCTPAGNCLPSGLLNLTNCLSGIPIIMTCPHFLYCDPRYQNQVDGLLPKLEKHATIVFAEPLTGILMKANKRIQFNTFLTQDPRIDATKKMAEVLYPLFWVDENFNLDEKNANDFYYNVQLPIRLLNWGKFIIFFFGLILLMVSSGFWLMAWNKSRIQTETPTVSETTPLINNI